MRGVKPETKSAVSVTQARAKVETDIKGIVERTRSATKAKTKVLYKMGRKSGNSTYLWS